VTHILYVEDNEVDSWLTRAILTECGIPFQLHVVKDGMEALNFLEQSGPIKNECWPDLILLDLKMPGMDGIEFLQVIKQDAFRSSIPVVILTTSSNSGDIEKTYAFQAAAYLNKPLDRKELVLVIENLSLFTPRRQSGNDSPSE
jgi:two-component system, chemotaxis family, response regulator Rcp1